MSADAETAPPYVSRPEKWRSLRERIDIHMDRQPDMTTQIGPRRWARHLLEWALEAMRIAYPKGEWQAEVREVVKDFLVARPDGLS